MPEQVTFEKVKSNGSVVKKQVPVFRDGDWKEWLEWLLRLPEYFMFMGYSQSDADQLDFVEDVQVLLHDDDLLLFNETVAEEQYVSNNVAIQALRRLTAVHCPPGTWALIMDQLMQTKKTRTMTVREYARNFRKLLRMIPFVEENEPVPEADLVRMFKSGMPVDWQLELNRHARTWDLTSMEAQFEAIERNEKEAELLRGNRPAARRPAEQHDKDKSRKPAGGRRHSGQQPDRNWKSTTRQNTKQCSFCDKKGHLASECYRNPNSPSYKPRSGRDVQRDGNAFAVMQEQMSQMAAMMETIKQRQDEELNAMRFYREEEMNVFDVAPRPAVAELAPLHVRRPVGTSNTKSEPVMETEVLVGTHRFRALIDTGCSSSAIEQSVVSKTKELVKLTRSEAIFRQANKSTGRTTHVATTQLILPVFSTKRCVTHDFRVAPTLLYPVILGKDFLSRQGINLLFATKQLEWDGVTVPMATEHGARVAAAALAAPEEECPTEIAVDDALEEEVVTSLLEGTALEEEEQRVMAELFSEFPLVCSGCLGLITGKPYVLPLKPGAIPFACRPFPVPQAYLPALKKEIARLVKLGVLIPDSDSPWASPAFTVPKKDGSIRLVCDFRRLNRLLDRHFYPLPKISEILRQLRIAKFVTALDVPMGYYARELAVSSRPATAIVFPFGKCEIGKWPRSGEFRPRSNCLEPADDG